MADVIDQIQQEQARQSNAELAQARHDYNWNSTFGKIAPENVLREARDMTALINNAIEKKMQLAAQTSEEAQRIFINDQKFKAWEKSQPLRDDLLRAQVADEEASERARIAQERLTTSRRARDLRTMEHSASAQLKMDEIESSALPEAEKRALLNTVRGEFPGMDAATAARHKALHDVFTPKTPEQISQIEAEYAARARGAASAKPAPETEEARIARIRKESEARAAGTAAGKPAPKPEKPDYGTVTTKLDDKTSLRRPAKAFEEEVAATKAAQLSSVKAKHDELEAKMNAKAALEKKQDDEDVIALNVLKKKLGYAPSTPGEKPVEAPKPTGTPAPAAKPAQTPEEWLKLNPNDPRAPAIRAKLGIK